LVATDKEADRFTVYAVAIESEGCSTTFYDCLQEIEAQFYTQDHLNKLKSLFEVDPSDVEKAKKQFQQETQAQAPRVARKTAKPEGKLADNKNVELHPAVIEEEEQKLDIAERTRQRLVKYGILQLRTVNHYMLRRIKIPIAHLTLNKRIQAGHAETLPKPQNPSQQM